MFVVYNFTIYFFSFFILLWNNINKYLKLSYEKFAKLQKLLSKWRKTVFFFSDFCCFFFIWKILLNISSDSSSFKLEMRYEMKSSKIIENGICVCMHTIISSAFAKKWLSFWIISTKIYTFAIPGNRKSVWISYFLWKPLWHFDMPCSTIVHKICVLSSMVDFN